jgi:hypothetical protein
MENIHLIKTDKPTGIFETNSGLQFSVIEKVRYGEFKGFHIYITSDEEIKPNEWYLFKGKTLFLSDNKFDEGNNPNNSNPRVTDLNKKIILTTDPTLIDDGVQGIDDEFLEWFVKNPTCEFIHVYNDRLVGYEYDNYTIILPSSKPQEEPKQELDCPYDFTSRCTMGRCDCKPKKETLEEDDVDYKEEPKQVICRDKFDRVIQHGYYVDVQKDGVCKVYRKEDGQLYFNPYGEEERVSNYFSNDLILISYNSKLMMDFKKEIKDKKQQTLEETKRIHSEGEGRLQRFIDQFGDGELGELDPNEWDALEFLEWLKLNNYEIIKK